MESRQFGESAGSGAATARPEPDRRRWLEGWPRLIRTLGAALEADELFERVCRDVVEGFGFSRALIATVDEKNRRLVSRAGYDPNMRTQLYMALFRLFRVPLVPERDGRLLVSAWSAVHQQQAYVPDSSFDSFRPDEATQRPFLIKALGTSEYVVTPIVYRGRSIAVLGVDKKGKGEITSGEQSLLRDVAELLALRLGPLIDAEAEASSRRRGAVVPGVLDSGDAVHALLDGLEEALLVVGPDQRVRYANPAAAGLLGLDPWQIAGSPLKDALHPGSAERFWQLVESARTKQQSLKKRERLLRASGLEVEVRVVVLPLGPESDARAILMVPDGARGEPGRFADEVFRSALHDLVAPLQSIVGFAELLQMGRAGALSAEQMEFVARIVTGGEELIEFVHRLLTATALESRQERARDEAVSAKALIDRVFARLDGKALRAHVRLVRDVESALPPLRGDPAHFAAVFQNLVDNAIDATGAGGTVRVRAAANGDRRFARFTVGQEAGEHPQGAQPATLDEYWSRGGAARRRRSHGLGLAIVRRVVEAHGGELWAEGEPEADLSITFTLPLDA